MRLHQRPPSHSLIVKARVNIVASIVTSGDQRCIKYDTSMMRGVCALNGMIRKTGVNTITITIAMSRNNESQRIFLLGMFISSAPSCLSDHCYCPQHSDRKEWKKIDQQIPASVAGRRGFDCRDCFRISLCAHQPHAHSPEFFRVEVHEGAVLNLARDVLAWRRVKGFGQATAVRLHADLYL